MKNLPGFQSLKYLLLAIQTAICTLFSSGNCQTKQEADSIMEFIQNNFYSQGEKSKESLAALYRISREQGDYDLLAEAIYWDALIEYAQSNSETAMVTRIDSLLQLPQIASSPYRKMLLNHSLSMANIARGDFPEAFRNAHQAYLLAREGKDSSMIAITASSLGNIGQYLQDYKLSDFYYQTAIRFLRPGSANMDRILINRSRLKFLQQDWDSAILLLNAAMPGLRAGKDSSTLAIAYINQGSYYTGKGKSDSAFLFYRIANRLADQIANNNIRLTLYGNLGNYYRDGGRYDSALSFYREARKTALEDSNISQYAQMAYEMSLLFTANQHPDSAYAYLNEYNTYLARIQQPQTAESYRKYVDLVMESSNQKIKISEQEAALKSKQLLITLILSSACLVVFALMLLITIERKRRMRQAALLKEVENKDLAEQLEHEQQIQQLQQEKMEQKVRELSSYSLLLASKNNILQEVSGMLEQMDKENLPDLKSRAKRLIGENLRTDEDYWNTFAVHFNQVNPTFFANLAKRFPGITANEQKLCAYIKIGMTSKQIASMLNLAPRSVNTNRYRLRKRFGLEQDDDLDQIVKSL